MRRRDSGGSRGREKRRPCQDHLARGLGSPDGDRRGRARDRWCPLRVGALGYEGAGAPARPRRSVCAMSVMVNRA